MSILIFNHFLDKEVLIVRSWTISCNIIYRF